MNVFLDTNVVIDFMGEREGFFDDAAAIFAMIESKIITASVSALTVVNCAYILKKAFNTDLMLEKVETLCQLLDITPVDRTQLMDAIRIRPYDYEDAVQYMSALSSRPDVIITRDKRGFSHFDILVMTPAEFVKKAKA